MSEVGDKTAAEDRITQTGEGREADLAQVGEIEVTPEMIEAGETEYYGGTWDRGPDSYPGPSEEMLVAIYRAMAASAKGCSSLE